MIGAIGWRMRVKTSNACSCFEWKRQIEAPKQAYNYITQQQEQQEQQEQKQAKWETYDKRSKQKWLQEGERRLIDYDEYHFPPIFIPK